MRTRIQGVVFDLDGTLYSLRAARARVTMRLWRDLGLLRHVSRARAALRGQQFDGARELRTALYAELGRRAKVPASRAAAWYEDRFLTSFVALLRTKARPRPGLIELLVALRTRGVRLAVLSDYGSVAERLQALGVPEKLFDDVLSAEDLGVLKPSPKPLLVLAQKWELERSSLIMVGDRGDLDAACARAAGIPFLGVADVPKWRQTRGFFRWGQVARILKERTNGPAHLDAAAYIRHQKMPWVSDTGMSPSGECV